MRIGTIFPLQVLKNNRYVYPYEIYSAGKDTVWLAEGYEVRKMNVQINRLTIALDYVRSFKAVVYTYPEYKKQAKIN
jgi:hypothetical protein